MVLTFTPYLFFKHIYINTMLLPLDIGSLFDLMRKDRGKDRTSKEII